jgi:hypothetical protein
MPTTTRRVTIADRVATGAAWLDEQTPGWIDRIDLDRLRLGDGDLCVLGQIYGSFGAVRGFAYGATSARVPFLTHSDCCALGFDIDVDRSLFRSDSCLRSAYYRLTVAWRNYIQGRRLAESRVPVTG